MAHGGKREGAGRKPGASTRLNEEARKQAAEGGLMPLDYMLQILRDESMDPDARMDAAKAAAPYVHAKLAAAQISGPDGGPIESNVTVSLDADTVDRIGRNILGDEGEG